MVKGIKLNKKHLYFHNASENKNYHWNNKKQTHSSRKSKTTCNSVEFMTIYCSGCHVNDPCVQHRNVQDGLSMVHLSTNSFVQYL